MSLDSRALVHDRLTELVVELTGARHCAAQDALEEALARNGDAGDQLLNIADAIISVRKPRAAAVPADWPTLAPWPSSDRATRPDDETSPPPPA